MGKRSEALELARFLAFDGRNADEISLALQVQCGLGEHEATRMALNVLAPAPPDPSPPVDDLGSILPPY